MHIFYEYFRSEGSKWKLLKKNKTVTQHLKTRNYWLRAWSDVKKIIGNQNDLYFYECLAEYVASLYLGNVVWAH